MHGLRRGLRCGLWRVLLAALLIGGAAACSRDKGDPKRITRDFMLAVWTGDVDRVRDLTCRDWRDTTTEWARSGDPAMIVDAEHLRFEVRAESEAQAEVILSGVVTFKVTDEPVEVRDLDAIGTMLFTLVDESGWKVCGLEELDAPG